MPIKIKHGKAETALRFAEKIGQAKEAARLAEKQMEIDYRTNLQQQELAMDLQLRERAKLWEIEKMELASRMDFAREERQRQRKLDEIDNKMRQIDKEVEVGRMTEQEAYPIKLSLQLGVPTSALPTEKTRFGVAPYWMAGREEPVGSPMRRLYEAKMKQMTSITRTGTVPYYLDPAWLQANRGIAQRVLEAREIFLEENEIDDFITSGLEPIPEPISEIGLPIVTTDAEYDALPSGTEFIDPEGNRRRKP